MDKKEMFLYEQNRLKSVIEYINKKIEIAQRKFDEQEHTIIGFKEGQRGTQFTRQSLMSLYATEVYDLKQIVDNPYFGMFEFKSNNKTNEIYLGKKAVLDDKGNPITFDWRSPICSMYYDYNIGNAEYENNYGEKEKGEILKKRQILVKKGELIDVDEQDTLSNDSVLLKYLKENSDARLKSIIATIQKEQNAIIRSPLRNDYIVQGVAGSGKTTVALHRIAYLLYNEAKNINESDFMILGPNKYFLNYISDLLPDLDIHNVTQYTFDEIALNMIRIPKNKIESRNTTLQEVLSGEADENIIKFKSSIPYLKLLEDFVNVYVMSHLNEDIKFDGVTFFTADDIKSYFENRVTLSEKGYKERANDYIKILIRKIKENPSDYSHKVWLQYKDEFLSLAKDDPRRKELLTKIEALEKEVRNGCPNTIKEYFKFLNVNPLVLYQAFIDSIDKLYPNCEFDLKKLQEYTSSKLAKKKVCFEDLSPMMLIDYKINGAKNYKDFAYLVIDEAQDLSLSQYYVLKKLFPKAKFNVFGDVNQSIYDYQSVHDWTELNDTIFDSKAINLDLNKSYRTTVNISDAANLVLDELNQSPAECIARQGAELTINDSISIQTVIAQINTLLDKNYQSIAVICKDDKETKNVYNKLKKLGLNITEISEKNEEFNGGLCIMPSYLSKGLEFDAVVIYNANDINYTNSSIDNKLLYVSMTRPMHELYIDYDQNLPHALRTLTKSNQVLKKK